MTRSGDASDPDLLHRFVEVFLAFFSTWTIYCNLLVYSGQGLDVLTRYALIPVVAGAGLLWLLGRLDGEPLEQASPVRAADPPPVARALPFVLAILAVASFAIGRSYVLLWLLSMAALATALVGTKGAGSPPGGASPGARGPEATTRRRLDRVIPLVVAALAALVTLVAHRSDGDDSLYLNVIVTGLDFPAEPLLGRDGLHGLPGLPFAYAVYRLHAFELLDAVLAGSTGLAPLDVYYLLLPPIFAGLVVAGQWLLIRLLAPSVAPLALCFVFVFTLAWGDSHWSPGNFAYVRLHQGKAVFASAMVPVIVYYALRFSRRGDARSWTLLLLAQVASVGLTSSAIFVAPVTAGLVLVAGWRPDAASTRRLVIGAAASVHTLAAIVLVVVEGAGTGGMASSAHPFFSSFAGDFEGVLGHGGRAVIALLSLLTVPLLVEQGRVRRQLTVFVLLFVVFFLCPWTSEWLSALLERHGAAIVTWRFFWILPIPVFVALAAARTVEVVDRRRGRAAGGLAAVLAVVAFTVWPEPWTLSAENRTRLAAPGYKVDGGHRVAAIVSERTPPGARVLAPEEVARWVPSFRRHPHPEVVRLLYMRAFEGDFGPDEFATRMLLHDFVSNRRSSPALLERAMALILARQIETVAFRQTHPMARELAASLQREGFEGVEVGRYEVWSRARGAVRSPGA